MEVKFCKGCSTTKDVTEFFPDRRKEGRYRPRCKSCEAEYQRTRSPEQKLMYSRNWRDNNPESATEKYQRDRERRVDTYVADPLKAACRRALRTALDNGTIIKPDHCSSCGVIHDSIHGHHADYSKPLEVEWLCPRCHGLTHRI